MNKMAAKSLTRKQKRLGIILILGVVLALATSLILTALRDEIVFFFSPTELVERPELSGQAVRIGGLVLEDSWVKSGEKNTFFVTDGATELEVIYVGLLPDLFREGQGVVAEGKLAEAGIFEAKTVLAKHDENYVPREVEEALKAQGNWREEDK